MGVGVQIEVKGSFITGKRDTGREGGKREEKGERNQRGGHKFTKEVMGLGKQRSSKVTSPQRERIRK